MLAVAGLIVIAVAALAMLVTLRWGSDEVRFVGAAFPKPAPPPPPAQDGGTAAEPSAINPPPEVMEPPSEDAPEPPEERPKPAVFGVYAPGARPEPRTTRQEPRPEAGHKAQPAAQAEEGERGTDGVFSDKVSKKLDAIWTKYAEKSAAIKGFKTELYGKPDTKALVDRYNQDGDLWAYLKGGIANANWRKATVKAFASPDAAKMLMEMVRATPADSLEKVGEQIQRSRAAESLLQDVSAAAGIPMKSLLSGGAPSQEDLLRSVMRNPDFKKALDPDRRSKR